MPNVKTREDTTWVMTLKGHVSGTDGGGPSAPRNMTGTLDDGPPGAVVSYPSGSLAALGLGNILAPSGSILLQLPQGQGNGSLYTPLKDVLNQTGYWHVTWQASGTAPGALTQDGAHQYRIVQYAHISNSGSYLFGLQRLSGTVSVDSHGSSGSWVAEVPMDRVNPGSMVGEWSTLIYGRKTMRQY